MIPEHIKARFLHEYIKSSNLEALRSEIAAGLRGPAGPPPDFRVHMIAALEAVAAEFWEQGREAGDTYGYDCRMAENWSEPYPPSPDNPYQASEGK